MRIRTGWLTVIVGLGVALAACNSGSGSGGNSANGGAGFSLASLAGTWSYVYTQNPGNGGSITWDAGGKITQWRDNDCNPWPVLNAMTFTVSPVGKGHRCWQNVVLHHK